MPMTRSPGRVCWPRGIGADDSVQVGMIKNQADWGKNVTTIRAICIPRATQDSSMVIMAATSSLKRIGSRRRWYTFHRHFWYGFILPLTPYAT